MVSSRARRRAYADEIADIVNKAVSAMAQVPATRPQTQSQEDRRGWEIQSVVAEEDVHHAKDMLEVAKAQITETCQASKYARLLGSRSPWRDVHCGFRALVGFMEDDTTACPDVYEHGECCNRAQCSRSHPRLIKRLFVMVKPTRTASTVDFSESNCEGIESTSLSTKSTRSSQSGLSTTNSESAQTGQSWSSASRSESASGLLGYGSVEADGSSISEGSPIGPLPPLSGLPNLDLSCQANSEHPHDIQAPPLHEMAFGVPIEAHLRSRLVISL